MKKKKKPKKLSYYGVGDCWRAKDLELAASKMDFQTNYTRRSGLATGLSTEICKERESRFESSVYQVLTL